MKQLKIGLLGFGAMGKTHTYAIQNLPFYFEGLPFTATVAGVATAHSESARARQTQAIKQNNLFIPVSIPSQSDIRFSICLYYII